VAPDDDLVLRAKAMMAIGYERLLQGDPATASRLIGDAVELHRRAGERLALCESLVARASIVVLGAGGDEAALGAAVADVMEATTLAAETPNPIMLAQVVLPQAIVASTLGRFHRAATLIGVWETLEVDHGVHFPDIGLSTFGDPAGNAHAALGELAYAEAFAVGRAMSIEQMVGFLLDLDAGDDG
jgi:hypothetical protein